MASGMPGSRLFNSVGKDDISSRGRSGQLCPKFRKKSPVDLVMHWLVTGV